MPKVRPHEPFDGVIPLLLPHFLRSQFFRSSQPLLPTMINRGESADPTSQKDARGSAASELHDVLRVEAPGGGVRIAIENRHRHKAGLAGRAGGEQRYY